VERLRELLGADAREVDADAWDAHTSLTDGPHAGGDGDGPALDGAVVRIGCAPTRLAPLVEQLPATAVTAGLATGVATVTVPGAAVAEVHDAVAAVGGTSVLRDRPEALDAPAWGPAPSALALLKAIKNQLDPEARFAAGRFAPWM
jgi:glycolate oxidase FAD binding subunit